MTATATAPRRPRVDPRIWRRRVEVARARGRKRLRVVVVLGVVAVVVVGGLVVLHSPLLSARHVRVIGASRTSRAAVLRASGLGAHPPLVDVSPGAAASAVEALPWVASATVTRQWPDSATVRLTERVPVAAVGRGASASALVDGTGRVLEWSATPAAADGLAVLQLSVSVGRPGTTLPPAAAPGLAVATALAAAAVPGVQTVTVSGPGDVTVGLAHGVQVLFGRARNLSSEVGALASVLAGAPPAGPAVIDVRVPGEPTVATGGAPAH